MVYRFIFILLIVTVAARIDAQIIGNSNANPIGFYYIHTGNPIYIDSLDFSLSIDSAWSFSIWQFLPSSCGPYEIIRLSSSDTSTNYFSLNVNSSNYLEFFAAKSGFPDYRANSQNELEADPKVLSGVIEHKDWYNFIVTHGAGDTVVSMYVNNSLIEFSNISNSFFSIHGAVDIKITNTNKSSVFRLFSSELTESQVQELSSNNLPSGSTNISSLYAGYTHGVDSVLNDTMIIIDETGENNGYCLSTKKNAITDFRINQVTEQKITVGQPYIFDFFGGYNTFNYDAGFLKYGYTSGLNVGPTVWYDSTSNRTYIGLRRHTGLGGDMEPMVVFYDHEKKILSRAAYYNTSGSNGLVDTHPGTAVMSAGGDNITVTTEVVTRSGTSSNDLGHSTISTGNTLTIYNNMNIKATPGQFRYNCLQRLGDTIYMFFREAATDISFYKSVNDGESWGAKDNIIDSNTDAMYPTTLHVPGKMAIVCARSPGRPGNGFDQSYFLQTTDGEVWYNADSSYSQNALSSPITIATLDSLFLIKEDEVNSASTPWVCYGGGRFLMIGREYAADTVSNIELYYTDGASPIQKKIIPGLSDYSLSFQIIHVSGDTYDLFSINPSGDLVRLRTDDFFESIFVEEQLTNGVNLEPSLLFATVNQTDTDEIIIIAMVNAIESPSQHLFFYVYTIE